MRLARPVAAALAAAALTVTVALPAEASAAKVGSTYLAGYQVSAPGISRATATVVMPSVTCDPTQTQGIQFGIGNEPTAGNLSLLAGVRILCAGGSPQYFGYAFGTATRQVMLSNVAPGDKFDITVLQTKTSLTVTANDTTLHERFQVRGAPVPDNTLTFGAFPLESGITPLPVPDFGSVTVHAPVLENTDLSGWSPTVLVRHNGATTQIGVGAFLSGGSFRLNYRNS